MPTTAASVADDLATLRARRQALAASTRALQARLAVCRAAYADERGRRDEVLLTARALRSESRLLYDQYRAERTEPGLPR